MTYFSKSQGIKLTSFHYNTGSFFTAVYLTFVYHSTIFRLLFYLPFQALHTWRVKLWKCMEFISVRWVLYANASKINFISNVKPFASGGMLLWRVLPAFYFKDLSFLVFWRFDFPCFWRFFNGHRSLWNANKARLCADCIIKTPALLLQVLLLPFYYMTPCRR